LTPNDGVLIRGALAVLEWIPPNDRLVGSGLRIKLHTDSMATTVELAPDQVQITDERITISIPRNLPPTFDGPLGIATSYQSPLTIKDIDCPVSQCFVSIDSPKPIVTARLARSR
jgi:hypothetical protein